MAGEKREGREKESKSEQIDCIRPDDGGKEGMSKGMRSKEGGVTLEGRWHCLPHLSTVQTGSNVARFDALICIGTGAYIPISTSG